MSDDAPTWAALFERAAEFDVSLADVEAALADRRGTER